MFLKGGGDVMSENLDVIWLTNNITSQVDYGTKLKIDPELHDTV